MTDSFKIACNSAQSRLSKREIPLPVENDGKWQNKNEIHNPVIILTTLYG